MSYNKLKSLVANVEAIETAMKIQVQGRQATAEEKEILSRYSGFGGIKEVLNIGTDKPIGGDMQEPIQRLQELINAYPHFTEPMRHNVIEGIKASVLTAFYTPKFLVDAVVRQIHAFKKGYSLLCSHNRYDTSGCGNNQCDSEYQSKSELRFQTSFFVFCFHTCYDLIAQPINDHDRFF